MWLLIDIQHLQSRKEEEVKKIIRTEKRERKEKKDENKINEKKAFYFYLLPLFK